MTLKPVPTSGRSKVSSSNRHHIEPRVQLLVPKEETFLVPLKCIDVTRAAFSNLDVLQEKRVDVFLNVDANRSLSDSRPPHRATTTCDQCRERVIHTTARGSLERSLPALFQGWIRGQVTATNPFRLSDTTSTRSSRCEQMRTWGKRLLCVFASFSSSHRSHALVCFVLFHSSCFLCLCTTCHLHVWYKASGLPRSENASRKTTFTVLKETSNGIHVVRVETDKNSSNYQIWEFVAWNLIQNGKSRSGERKANMGKREAKTRQCSKIERHLFHRSGRCEYQETIKNARRKLKVPMEAAMPCKKKRTKKRSGSQETEAKSCESNMIPKTKHACIVEAHESTRQRLESSPPKDH